jgi:hypothetical protein
VDPVRTLCLTIVVMTALSAATAGSAARGPRQQTLFFDATFTQVRTAGPAPNKVGHVQIANGSVSDARGHSIGRVAFSCRWVESLPNDDAREQCSGSGRTADGRLAFAGSADASDHTHSWSVSGVSGAYRGARGTLVTRDIGPVEHESMILLTVTPRSGVTLRFGVVPRPSANTAFLARANGACTAATARIAKLPRFSIENFDPLHPEPGLLPKVGQFFSGPGDSRPMLHALHRQLVALGPPPANARAWNAMLHSLAAKTVDFERQVRTALAADVPGWVHATKAALTGERRLLVADAVFGTDKCAF